MTDLISSLADSILALVNSRPQTPTHAEIKRLFNDVFGEKMVWCLRCGDRTMATFHPEGRYHWAGLCTACGALHNLDERKLKAAHHLLRPNAGAPCEIDHKGVPSGEHRWHSCRNADDTLTLPAFDRCLCGALTEGSLERALQAVEGMTKPRALAEIKERWAAEDKLAANDVPDAEYHRQFCEANEKLLASCFRNMFRKP
jgi:hypothetical protein